MKKLLLIFLLFISVKAFSQTSPVTLQVKGGNGVNYLPYMWTGKAGPDTLFNGKYLRATFLSKSDSAHYVTQNAFRDSLLRHTIYFTRNFVKPDSVIDLADTIHKNRWVFISTDTLHPVIKLFGVNHSITQPSIIEFWQDNIIKAQIGAAGTYYGPGISALSGSALGYVETTPTGVKVTARKTNGDTILNIKNYHEGTGPLLAITDSTGNGYFRFDKDAFYYYNPTDTTGATKGLVYNPATGKVYSQTISGGSGITALTGDVIAAGTGSVAATVVQINGITKTYYDPTSSIQTQLDAKVPTARTITINGTTLDLSANRSWTVGSSVTPVTGETPTGSLNGSNVTFVAAHTPISGSFSITYNGLTLQPTVDYTLIGATATLLLTGHLSGAPVSTDYLLFNYQY